MFFCLTELHIFAILSTKNSIRPRSVNVKSAINYPVLYNTKESSVYRAWKISKFSVCYNKTFLYDREKNTEFKFDVKDNRAYAKIYLFNKPINNLLSLLRSIVLRLIIKAMSKSKTVNNIPK